MHVGNSILFLHIDNWNTLTVSLPDFPVRETSWNLSHNKVGTNLQQEEHS